MPRSCSVLIAGLAAAALTVGAASAQGSREPPRFPEQGGQAVPQPRTEKQFPLGSAWSLVSFNGRPVGGERPTLLVDAQLRGKGFAGCNTYSATAFPLREQGIAVGPVAVTRRACEAAAMATERSFLVALRSARKWDIVGGQFVLQGQAGELRFERAL